MGKYTNCQRDNIHIGINFEKRIVFSQGGDFKEDVELYNILM